MRTLAGRIGVLWLICGAVSCGGSSGGGTQPTEDPPPTISCPAPINLQIVGQSLALQYPAPTVTGGTAPVTVNCLPVSGSQFPLGQTTVACSATDARTRRADCSFSVTLTAGTIGATKYLAFGDSVTYGTDGFESMRVRRLMAIARSQSYPSVLESLLRRDYPAQTFVVDNHGVPGARLTVDTPTAGALNPVEFERLGDAIDGTRPQAVLLLMGYNDLLSSITPSQVRDALREFVKLASAKRVPFIFLSNLTPPGPTGNRKIDAGLIVQTNDYIGQIAAQEQVVLVNAHDAFLGREAQLISDGLHPNAAGYEVLAQTFYDAIRRTVGNVPPSNAATASSKLISPRK